MTRRNSPSRRPDAARCGEEIPGHLGGVGGLVGEAKLEAGRARPWRQRGRLVHEREELGVAELGVGGPREAPRRRVRDEEGARELAREGGRPVEEDSDRPSASSSGFMEGKSTA